MNTASLLMKQAELLPSKTAIVYKDEKITFKELDDAINRLARYFSKRGIKPGTKVILFIPPSIELTATTFALFKIGAVPIFIDPGMGLNNLLNAIREVAPNALIAGSLIGFMSGFFRRAFSGVDIKLDFTRIREASRKESPSFQMYDATEDEMAAILFTSGGTGKPKGVVYTHKIFIAQTKLLKEIYSLTPDDVDCPCFSLFSFFTVAMGLTSYFPDMNHSNPANTDPGAIAGNLMENKTTFAAGSPIIWDKVADYCNTRGIQLPLLKSVVMFGAPVTTTLHEKWQKILPNGTTYTPYGATESLPITNISGEYILGNTADKTLEGAGTCVGKAVPSVEVEIFNEDEIVVSGETTTREYYNEKEATRESKIEMNGKLWHKTGDVGTIDDEGLVWFWGRKGHVVYLGDTKMYPIPCEAVFFQNKNVKRAALVGPSIEGRTVPTLVIEPQDGNTHMSLELHKDLYEIRDRYEHTRPIEKFYLKQSFPVDVRHNIKIDRIQLRKWVEDKFK